MTRFRYIDGEVSILARNVVPGDLLDFEGDSIADVPSTSNDPDAVDAHESNRFSWEFSFSEVLDVVWEGLTCVVLYTTGGAFAFPPDHAIDAAAEQPTDAPPCLFCHGNGEDRKATQYAPQVRNHADRSFEMVAVCDGHAADWWDGSDYPDGEGVPPLVHL